MISHKDSILPEYCDSIVMLTWSNWKTEPRSNRYHYASRFSPYLPVIFVQPDLFRREAKFEETEIKNVTILHVYKVYGPEQTDLLNKALLERGLTRPLLWVYNAFFFHFIAQRYSLLVVYHATEDYFSPDAVAHRIVHEPIRNVLKYTDLLVAVSQEVLLSYKNRGMYSGQTLLLENGCDFKFWAPTPHELQQLTRNEFSKKVAFYQGGINDRLDVQILRDVCKALPDWEIWLCGAAAQGFEVNPERLPNLKNFGFLGIEKVRDLAYQATVGIIPFIQNDVIRVSLPLKAFEYVACGLPVVTVPIPALEKYPEAFSFAGTSKDFSYAIIQAAQTRHNEECIVERLKVAREQDYDKRFIVLLNKIDSMLRLEKPASGPLNTLVLYDAGSVHINTIKEHLVSFVKYSHSNVFYVSATHQAICTIDLSVFHAIIIHYSVRLSVENHISFSYAEALRRFGGYKVLFIQDEYDTTETVRRWIERLGIHTIFTCVPEEYVDKVYPRNRFPYLERIHTLTGFVPISIQNNHTPKPISERHTAIGYRGHNLPFHYGDLGREKTRIAQRMKQICRERNIPEDIEWLDEKRIYGDQWYSFIESSKATLGTESGSNVFDDHGEIRRSIERAIARNPTLSYEEIHSRYISNHEGKVKMNQISPRIFEAIALRTALVLFEGEYSGVVQPDIHYIPLKKDFSNIEDVLAKLLDDQYLIALTERAYSDVIASKKYTYEQFVRDFDSFLSNRLVSRDRNIPEADLLDTYDSKKQKTQMTILNKLSPISFLPASTAETRVLPPGNWLLDVGDIIELNRLWIRQRFPHFYDSVNKYYNLLMIMLKKLFK